MHNEYQGLVKQAKFLITNGMFDQHELFAELTKTPAKVHYSTVRRAIDEAKCR